MLRMFFVRFYYRWLSRRWTLTMLPTNLGWVEYNDCVRHVSGYMLRYLGNQRWLVL